jgi:hypothetical protein
MKHWAGMLRKNLWVLAPVLVLGSALVAGFLILQKSSADAAAPVSCSGANADQFSCWQKRYNAMVAEDSPEAAMKEFRTNYDQIPYVKSNCHQIAHVIGRAAAKKYPTLAETYQHGDDFCASGYYHGAIETVAQEIGADKIVSQVNNICAEFMRSEPYKLKHFNCVHGLGHGLMAVQNGELFTSLKTCDNLEGQWQQESCDAGVFMENVMNEINVGKHSSYLKKDDPLYPCTAVEARYLAPCYLMQTSHALIVRNYDYAKVFGDCSTVPAPNDDICYQSLGRDVSGLNLNDQAKTIELCNLGQTTAAKDNCFIGAVKDFVWHFHDIQPGLKLCSAIGDRTLAASCKQTAETYYATF